MNSNILAEIAQLELCEKYCYKGSCEVSTVSSDGFYCTCEEYWTGKRCDRFDFVKFWKVVSEGDQWKRFKIEASDFILTEFLDFFWNFLIFFLKFLDFFLKFLDFLCEISGISSQSCPFTITFFVLAVLIASIILSGFFVMIRSYGKWKCCKAGRSSKDSNSSDIIVSGSVTACQSHTSCEASSYVHSEHNILQKRDSVWYESFIQCLCVCVQSFASGPTLHAARCK